MKNIMMASVCSAVVKALRVEKKCHAKNLCEKQENEQ
jgi:hypothetical protein